MKLAKNVKRGTALDLEKMAETSPGLKQILADHGNQGMTHYVGAKADLDATEEIVRVQLDLPQSRIETLKALMADLGISTRKDLFNNALTLLSWVADEKKKGNIIISLNEHTDTQKELVMLPLENIASVLGRNGRGSGKTPPIDLGGNDDDESEEEQD